MSSLCLNMSHSLLIAGVALGSMALSALGTDPPARAGADTLEFKRVAIHDDLFNCTAATLMVPADWKLTARAIWRGHPFFPATLIVSIHDPRTPRGMIVYPYLLFTDGIRESNARLAGPMWAAHSFPEGGNYCGYEVRRRCRQPADYLQQILIPRFRRELARAKIVSVENLPEYARARAELYGNVPGSQFTAQRVRVEYDLQGQPVEEDFYILIGELQIPQITTHWGAEVVSHISPKGQMQQNMPIFRTIEWSFQTDVQWTSFVSQVAQYIQARIKQASDAAVDMAMIRSRCNREISDTIRAANAERQKAQDRANEKWDQYIRGVEAYKGNDGKDVHAPSGYNRVFENQAGDHLILTNNAQFNPNQVQGNWTELKKKQ